MAKNRFSKAPRKGSKLRRLLTLLMRREGLTSYEALERGVIPNLAALHRSVDYLRDMGGWDIRVVGKVCALRKPYVVYRCVGRYRWSGSYRAFNADEVMNYREERMAA